MQTVPKFFKLLIFFLLAVLLWTDKVHCAVNSGDTTVRICTGDMPGQKKEIGADYKPIVCAYTFQNKSLITFSIVSFDLIYKGVNAETTEVISGKGCYLSLDMKRLLTNLNSETINNTFLDNIVLTDKNGRVFKVNGLKPIIERK